PSSGSVLQNSLRSLRGSSRSTGGCRRARGASSVTASSRPVSARRSPWCRSLGDQLDLQPAEKRPDDFEAHDAAGKEAPTLAHAGGGFEKGLPVTLESNS